MAELETFGAPLRAEVFTESDGTFRSLQIEDQAGAIVQWFESLEGSG